MNKNKTMPPSIPPEAYSDAYYRSDCHGYEEFQATRGEILIQRLARPLELANLSAGMQVLDVGCGRGELVFHCGQAGAQVWGIDYAQEALIFSKELTGAQCQHKMAFQRAAAGQLPFAANSFDIVFMLDIVEHLTPSELTAALDEARRVLKIHGKIIIHTMPNLQYYNIGYPIYRFFQMLRGKNMPKNPRERGSYAHLHINEQTPRNLKKALVASQFQTRVWLENIQDFSHETNPVIRQGMHLLTTLVPFKWYFCNDIFAIGIKRS